MDKTIQIHRQFCGPPKSGNGGHVSGTLGLELSGCATARLFAPPPLDQGLKLQVSDNEVQLFDGEQLIARS